MQTEMSEKAGRREWIGLAVIALPCLLYSMDLTVLNLALPRLSAELAPSSSELLWIVDIYGFLIAGMLVTMGNLGDRIGRRRLLLVGAACFGAASVLAAFSTSPATLIAARAVLGVAGATLAPSTLSLIRHMFQDANERTTAIGVWISSYSVGGAIGPLVGGVMLQHFWWGSVFLVGVPVMLLLLAVGPILLPEYRDPTARPLDLWSAVLSLMAVLPIIYGVKIFAQDGASGLPIACIAGGLVMAIAFARRQRNLKDPLIDFQLFRAPAFVASLATFMLGCSVAFGSYVFLGQYLQLVLGLSPLSAGIWTLPWSGGFVVGSLAAPVLARKTRPAFLMGGGLVLAAIGYAILTQIGTLGLAGMVLGTVTFSLGLAPVFTLGTDLVVGAAPPERAGAAAALSETSAELGGALGIAVFGSIGTAIYRGIMAHAPLDGVSDEARRAAQDTLGGATAEAARLSAHSSEAASNLLDTAREAFGQAFQSTLALCAVIAAATAVMTMFMLRRFPSHASREREDDACPETTTA
ncbi:MFS transporter [Pendulispora brunnea]|uniref:MFS transporter n=1 Tax=Pendulispora brunnea TaxID=2905690 RepID=A0ABZ2KIF8_9BACT